MHLSGIAAIVFSSSMMFLSQQTTQAPLPPSSSAAYTAPSTGAHYSNSEGQKIHRPITAGSAPAGTTARCRDNTYSFSQHRSGTCSHHGGVATWSVH